MSGIYWNWKKCQISIFQGKNFNSFRAVTHIPLTVVEFRTLRTFAVLAIKRMAASAMELWIGSIWRSLILTGSRLCGDLCVITANPAPFLGLYLTLLLLFFFFYRNLLEQGKQERVTFATLHIYFSNNLFYHSDDAASLPSLHRWLPGLCELLLWPCVGCLLIILSLNNLKESHSERGCPSEDERDLSAQ